jgi:hypothetical protein
MIDPNDDHVQLLAPLELQLELLDDDTVSPVVVIVAVEAPVTTFSLAY